MYEHGEGKGHTEGYRDMQTEERIETGVTVDIQSTSQGENGAASLDTYV